jgi:hypothetical protein
VLAEEVEEVRPEEQQPEPVELAVGPAGQ